LTGDESNTIQIQRNEYLERNEGIRWEEVKKNLEELTAGGTSAIVARKSQTTPLWGEKRINERRAPGLPRIKPVST